MYIYLLSLALPGILFTFEYVLFTLFIFLKDRNRRAISELPYEHVYSSCSRLVVWD